MRNDQQTRAAARRPAPTPTDRRDRPPGTARSDQRALVMASLLARPQLAGERQTHKRA